MDFHLTAITLDEDSLAQRTKAIEQEREVAISDLLEKNSFRPEGSQAGPYELALSVEDNRLVFDVRRSGEAHGRIMLSLTPLRRVIKDYFLICDSYYKAIRTAPPSQIEALDAGRRALHDEGAEELRARLSGKIDTDPDTSRRLFTLICVLQMRA